MNQESIKRIVSWILNPNGNTVIIYIPILATFGAPTAICLGVLVWAQERAEEEWFKLPFSMIEKKTGLRKKRIMASIDSLREQGLVEVERRGVPPFYFYRINPDKLIEVMESSINPKRPETGPMNVPKRDLQRGENGTYNTRPKKVSSNSLGIPDIESPLRSSIQAEDGEAPRSKQINEVILPILQKAVALGGFKNTFPGPGKAPTKSLLFAQKFLQSAFSGRLTRDFPMENKDDQRGSLVRYLKETGKTLEEVVYEACRSMMLLRGEDYGFPNKDKLPKDIGQFFYNPISKFSWFISLVFKPPVPLASKTFVKDYDAITFSPKEKQAIAALRGENWDPVMFKKKVLDLYNWYHKNKGDLREYAVALGLDHLWDEYFSSFAELCEQIRDFSTEWEDWKPANFGYGNATWDRFVKHVRERHQGLDLSPDVKKMEAAKIQWQRSHSGGLAESQKRSAEHVAFEDQAEAFRKSLQEGEEA